MKTNFISIAQTMQAFGISKSFLYQLRKKGKLKFYYVETKPFIKVEDFEDLMTPEDGKESLNDLLRKASRIH